ncbi:formate dehydrogenase accessory protein FdhE [uncultured Desulfovibrio sp.]|uniref:formate dehydrogenase accessory protein FdhE n=1 Tax=uncultured Desulfovibrio sp. TaxID=167968 RepID=UPI002638E4ED|nr:formate dehydrogenase accessory protein FdhE [uncultured Desulfovibrio sp.]
MTSRPTATPETAAPAAAAASEGTGKTARLIAILRDACPEQQALLDAFAPVLCLRETALAEEAARRAAAPAPATPETGTPAAASAGKGGMDVECAARWAEPLLDALKQGFPAVADAWEQLREAIRADAALPAYLCLARRGRKRPALSTWCKERRLSADAVNLFAEQFARLAGAAAQLGRPERESGDATCPYCGGRAEISLIHGTEGRRYLQCGHCSRLWRFKRTLCPHCGAEGNGILRHIFVDGQPDLRAVVCETCRHYILEADLRPRDMPLEIGHVLSLVMGHLDALAQEDGASPLSLSRPAAARAVSAAEETVH